MAGSNDCDEAGPGDNFAFCNIFSPDNDIGPIGQNNGIGAAGNLVVIAQDNGAVISQAINVFNDCDETSSTDLDNTQNVGMDGNLNHFI